MGISYRMACERSHVRFDFSFCNVQIRLIIVQIRILDYVPLIIIQTIPIRINRCFNVSKHNKQWICIQMDKKTHPSRSYEDMTECDLL